MKDLTLIYIHDERTKTIICIRYFAPWIVSNIYVIFWSYFVALLIMKTILFSKVHFGIDIRMANINVYRVTSKSFDLLFHEQRERYDCMPFVMTGVHCIPNSSIETFKNKANIINTAESFKLSFKCESRTVKQCLGLYILTFNK